jgi:hypothetical protein
LERPPARSQCAAWLDLTSPEHTSSWFSGNRADACRWRHEPILVQPLARTASPTGGVADYVWQQLEKLAGVSVPGLVPVGKVG